MQKKKKLRSGGLLYDGQYQMFEKTGKVPEPEPFDIHKYYASKGADMNKIYRLFGAMTMHEGYGRRTQQQVSQKDKGPKYAGPGSGAWQYEPESAKLAVQRFKQVYKKNNAKLPKWFKDFEKTKDKLGGLQFSILGKPEQLELMMADNLYDSTDGGALKRTNLDSFIKGDMDAGTFWAKNHKISGATDEKIKEVNDWYSTMDTDTVNNAVFTDDWDSGISSNPFRAVYHKDNYVIRKDRFGHRCTDGKCTMAEENAPVYYRNNVDDKEKTLWKPGVGPSREFAKDLEKSGNVFNYTPISKHRKGGLLYRK